MGKRFTAQQIMDNYEPGDWFVRNQTLEEFWDQKLSEAKEPSEAYGGKSLYEHIEEHGQKTPIQIGTRGFSYPLILEGHHRLAAMHHMNPNQFVKYRRIQR